MSGREQNACGFMCMCERHRVSGEERTCLCFAAVLLCAPVVHG